MGRPTRPLTHGTHAGRSACGGLGARLVGCSLTCSRRGGRPRARRSLRGSSARRRPHRSTRSGRRSHGRWDRTPRAPPRCSCEGTRAGRTPCPSTRVHRSTGRGGRRRGGCSLGGKCARGSWHRPSPRCRCTWAQALRAGAHSPPGTPRTHSHSHSPPHSQCQRQPRRWLRRPVEAIGRWGSATTAGGGARTPRGRSTASRGIQTPDDTHPAGLPGRVARVARASVSGSYAGGHAATIAWHVGRGSGRAAACHAPSRAACAVVRTVAPLRPRANCHRAVRALVS